MLIAHPEPSLTYDIAVIAGAALIVVVVPSMPSPRCFTVFTLVGNTDVDQEPR